MCVCVSHEWSQHIRYYLYCLLESTYTQTWTHTTYLGLGDPLAADGFLANDLQQVDEVHTIVKVSVQVLNAALAHAQVDIGPLGEALFLHQDPLGLLCAAQWTEAVP